MTEFPRGHAAVPATPSSASRVELLEPTAEAEPRPPAAKAAEPARTARTFRGGTVTVACELRTPRVVQFYKRDFTQVSHWLHGLDRARDFRSVDARAVDDAEAAIAARLSAVRATFDDAVLHTDTLLSAQGLAGVPIRYAAPVTVSAPIVHPTARTYLGLLASADDAFAGLERAWLLGLLDTRSRRQEEARFRKALRSVASAVREQYTAMARLLRGEKAAAGATVDGVGSVHGHLQRSDDPPADEAGFTPADADVSTQGGGLPSSAQPWWQAASSRPAPTP